MKRFIAGMNLCGLIAAALLLLSLAPAQSDESRGSWTARAPLPFPRSETAVVALDGKIYVLGGTAQGKYDSTLNQEYDPATDRWRDRAPLPHGQGHIGAVALSHKLYAIGGFTGNVHLAPVDLVFAYDPASDSWQTLAPISSPRGSVGAAVVGGKIHVIGGRGSDKRTVAIHEVYDPATNKWRMAAPLPLARDHLGIIAVGGKIHVFGGRTNDTHDNVARHDVYDPATDRWSTAAPLPTARSSGAAVLYHGLILYTGGECKDPRPGPVANGTIATFATNEAYDRKTGRWLTLAPLPAGLHAYGADAVGAYAYFVGGALGCGGGPMTAQVWAFGLK